MTDQPQLSPEDIAKRQAKALTLAITERQIDAAVMMAGDPENWAFTPVDNTTRTIYRRIKRRGA